jgi:hypothetical protein
MAYTTTDLLDSISKKAFIPEGQITFTSTDLLATADEQLLNTVVPAIMAVREEFFVTHQDYAITANQNEYSIPARAVGMIVREVAIVNGTTVNPDLPRLEPEQITSTATGTPRGFYVKNNKIVLYPTPSTTTNTLRLYFFLRPANLVAVSATAVISAINTTTNVVSVTTIPSTWVTGNSFDFSKYDGGQEPVGIDQTSTLISGTDITFSSLPSTLRVGDYVSIAGYTSLVPLPAEFRPILAQAVAAEILENTNQPSADRTSKKLSIMIATAQKLIAPRVQGEDRIIINNSWGV